MGQLPWYHAHTSKLWLFSLGTTPVGKHGRQYTAITHQNTAQQHGIYFNKQEGIIREEGKMVLHSRRSWLRTFHTSLKCPIADLENVKALAVLRNARFRYLLHHLFCQQLNMKLHVEIEI